MSSGGSKKDQQAHIAELITQNEALSSHVAFLEAHCALAVSDMQDMKHQMNARDAKTGRKKRKLNVLARCLTSEEGLAACAQQDEEDRQRAVKKVIMAA